MYKLLSFSGGQDSTYLILKNERKETHFVFNHLIQKNNLFFQFNGSRIHYYLICPYHICLPFYKLKNEIQSANSRYNHMKFILQNYDYNCVETGYTQSDELEKFFIYLFRGSANCLPYTSISSSKWKCHSQYFNKK